MSDNKIVTVLDIYEMVVCPIGNRNVPINICDNCTYHYTTDLEEYVVCCTHGVN